MSALVSAWEEPLEQISRSWSGCCCSPTGWKGFRTDDPLVLSFFLHLVGKVGVLVEQLAEVEHDGLPVEAGVGKDQLERLTCWTRLRCLRQLTVDIG